MTASLYEASGGKATGGERCGPGSAVALATQGGRKESQALYKPRDKPPPPP